MYPVSKDIGEKELNIIRTSTRNNKHNTNNIIKHQVPQKQNIDINPQHKKQR
jgi:hypothetical protein